MLAMPYPTSLMLTLHPPRPDSLSTTIPPSSPLSPAQLPGPTTRPALSPPLPDGLPHVSPLLDVELGISLLDALAALKVSLPQEQLDILHSSFVAVVAPVSHSNLARLRRELRRIGASAASILPPLAARTTRRTSLRVPSFGFLPTNEAVGGILLAWSPPLTGMVVHVGRYSISASFNGLWPNGPVLVTAVYGHCVAALRDQLWAELYHARQLAPLPWLLAEDFNCLLCSVDSFSPITSGPSMSIFRLFLEEFGLFDVPLNNSEFTWSNNRNPPIFHRLDRVFLSPELAGTEHARFRFDLWWLCDESFVVVVPKWWARIINGRWAAFRLSRKLHSIRKKISLPVSFVSSVLLRSGKLGSPSTGSNGLDSGSFRLSLEPSFAVSFNGLCGDFFSLGRSLRQGCLLSPMLFNLVAECFSVLFRHAAVVGFLTPHSLLYLQTFCTLQYADDFLLFGTASRQQIVRTWLILRVFEFISSLSINSSKCHFSHIHADLATVLLAEVCFGCKVAGLPMEYLGLQITLSPPAPSFWDGVEQKLVNRLHCGRKLLSLSDRIILAKHCLASVPLHALAVFRPPVVVLNRFDRIIRNFISDGDRPSNRLARGDMVVFPHLLEGAGVTNISRAYSPSIRILFLFCPSPNLSVSWGRVWRLWLISAWWRIWEVCNNRVFRGTFSSPEFVAHLVQGDIHFAIQLRRRPLSTAG
ncbi:hypothetical protein EJ110_NYTH26558 [Nymphaea thermarum]|nr:hypothetical protein EJ110_NYTH26558 [Nymphaea thermarum]